MSGLELICMLISLFILPGFILWHKLKSHGGIQPVDPLYLRVILVNWTLVPIAFSFTFFLTPYTLFEDKPLSFYSIPLITQPFLKEWHGIILLILGFILGIIGFLLCFFIALKLYLRCFITKRGLDTPIYIKTLYWLSSWVCLFILWAIIGIDIYSAYAAYHYTSISAFLLPIAFFILAVPLYYVE